ncbi:MAG: cytidine deaminase [Verrucomicrobia bacterium]|nr:cytidine deaminase [Verrucomicrobiota bacterium]
MLYELLPPNPFVLAPEKVEQLLDCCGIDVEELLQRLIPVAQRFARPQISNYNVGVAALGKSGRIYLGVNLEFPGNPLNCCIHGEQFMVANARNYGETELIAMALSAAPCGHCRQFLNEMGGDGHLLILTPNNQPTTLATLLPSAFGPQDLGLSGNLMTLPDRCRLIVHGSKLIARAIEAAEASYAPYSQSKSGVAIETHDGKIYLGSHLENAAFNPSISPLQAALISLVADMKDYSEIKAVAFYENGGAKISQEAASRALLKHIAPEAVFVVEKSGMLER